MKVEVETIEDKSEKEIHKYEAFDNTIFDIKDFIARLDKEFKWDKAHKSECGWDDHDITMIAEGMLQATEIINKMQLEAQQEKKEYKEVIHACWIFVEEGYKNRVKYYKCSHCGKQVSLRTPIDKYCLNCGAIMDKEV